MNRTPSFSAGHPRDTWDANTRLSAYDTSSGVRARYTYDPAGQRTRSEVSTDSVAGTTSVTFDYEGLVLHGIAATSMSGVTSYTIDYYTDYHETYTSGWRHGDWKKKGRTLYAGMAHVYAPNGRYKRTWYSHYL